MENGKRIISHPLSLYLSHSYHCSHPSFSNPNSISPIITKTKTTTKQHQQISVHKLFSFSLFSFFSSVLLFSSFSFSLFLHFSAARTSDFGLGFEFLREISRVFVAYAFCGFPSSHDLSGSNT